MSGTETHPASSPHDAGERGQQREVREGADKGWKKSRGKLGVGS